jgi:hypothetical protein
VIDEAIKWVQNANKSDSFRMRLSTFFIDLYFPKYRTRKKKLFLFRIKCAALTISNNVILFSINDKLSFYDSIFMDGWAAAPQVVVKLYPHTQNM